MERLKIRYSASTVPTTTPMTMRNPSRLPPVWAITRMPPRILASRLAYRSAHLAIARLLQESQDHEGAHGLRSP